MLDQHYYYCIEKNVTAEFTDRGSRFIAYAFPIASVEDFKECLNEVKRAHPKASHYCLLTGWVILDRCIELQMQESPLGVLAGRF